MSGKIWASLAVVAVFSVLITACSGSSTPGRDIIFDFGGDAVADVDAVHPDVTPDTEDIPVTDDLGQSDKVDIQDEGKELPPEVWDAEVEQPCEDGCVEDVKTDPGPPPICPCDTSLEVWVCGVDEVDYENDTCAACAICMDSPDCPGCTGDKACDPMDPEGPNGWILQKAKCEYCFCDSVKECGEKLGTTPPCPACGLGPDGTPDTADDVTYDDLCDMQQAYSKDMIGCNEDYDENINYFGACKEPPCDPCEGQPKNEVCGADGQTYKNFCTMMNCPGTTTLAYLGACLGADFCPDCQGDDKVAVCGKNGVTYANECAATTCKGQEIAYEGACCVECNDQPVNEVCGADFVTYPNSCVLLCLGIAKKYDGPCTCDCDMTEAPVCGSDGKDYINECWMACAGATKLYDGNCVGDCPQCPKEFTPVCAGGKTYPTQCFADCLGAGTGAAGVCSGCETICGTPENPAGGFGGEVCGENGITYPTSCFPQKCHYDGGLGFTTGACQ
ncbi:MAG: hypothetical protein GXP54_07165 [Deltaproteobacteria bacterium]|nr:hypothetical protein [Deltaproteobacteria bacterium]